MKLTVLMLTVLCLYVTAGSRAQGISLSFKNESLKTVLAAIKKQTSYYFVYFDDDLKNAHKVNIQVSNVPVQEALSLVFKNQPLRYTIEDDKYVLIKPLSESRNSTDTILSEVRGRVINEQGEVVAGATVMVKGSGKATATDSSGIFILSGVAHNATLVVSGTNIETIERKLSGTGSLQITARLKLKDAEEIFINTGYQRIKPNEITSSITVVSNDMLNQQTGATIIERLDGVTSGVMFPKQNLQNSPQFIIRGFSTIEGPKSPLIILDNFPYDGDISNINPNDVENISVLKDAAAASIWGARAANGVVVITTKKGKLNQPLSIELNTNVRMTGKPKLLSLSTISSTDYIDVEEMLFNNGHFNSDLDNRYSYPALSPVIEILGLQRSGVITQEEANRKIDTYRNNDIRREYLDRLYSRALAQQYAINLRGGSSNMSYYLSVGYDGAKDPLENIDNRLTIRSENQYHPLKSLQISLGVQYTVDNKLSGKMGYENFSTAGKQIPYVSLADNDGDALRITRRYRDPFLDTAGAGLLMDWGYYPLDDWKYDRTKSILSDLLANVGINYEVMKGLNIDVKYLYEQQSIERNNIMGIQSYQARDLINQFSSIDRTNGIVNYAVPVGAVLNRSTSALETNNIRGQLNFGKTFSQHNISAIIGAELRQTRVNGYSNRLYGYDESTLVTSKVDLINSYPTYITGSNAIIPGGESLSRTLNRYVSFYGNLAYVYDSRYIVSVSSRRDASNLFGVNVNNKWNPLWSSGLGWQVSNERFYHLKWLPYLKLKATYGYTGNTDPSRAAVLTVSTAFSSGTSNLLSAIVNQYPNPELRWEKVRTVNIGIDFATFRNILSGSIEVYQKNGVDLFGAASVDATTGLNNRSTIIKNVADMRGRGIDMTFNANWIDTRLKWNTTFLLSHNVSKVTKYYKVPGVLSGGYLNNGFVIAPLEGKEMHSIAALKYGGLDASGNPQGYWEKEFSTDYSNIVNRTPLEDLVYKPSIPRWFGSFINVISWKGISITANISYRLGYYFVKPSIYYGTLFNGGASIGSSDFYDRWRQPGDEHHTNVPAMVYPVDNSRDVMYNFSDALIYKADNIKLQYLNLAYNLDENLLKTGLVRLCQLYVNANNLGILWRANKQGIDPDYINTPISGKMFTIGLKANF